MAGKRRNDTARETSDREIVVSRVVDAPREKVWEAWTNPEHIARWWGPEGFRTTVETMDVRPGGVWTHVMHGPDGTDYPNKSVFTEVVKPERIAYSHIGRKPGNPEVRFESRWTFEDFGGRTSVTIRMVFPSAEARDRVIREYGAEDGARQTLARLDGHLNDMGVAGPKVILDMTMSLDGYVAGPGDGPERPLGEHGGMQYALMREICGFQP